MLHRPTNALRLSRMFTALSAALPLALLGLSASADAAVMISQVYGGGGNSGAPYTNDFVELHNSGAAAVSLTGWSLQYSSAAGSSWANQNIALSGSIPAGGYYLVQLGSAAAVGAALPAANLSSTGINISATAGKFALVSSTTALSGTCPSGGAVVDFVGYGSTANCFETAAAPAPSNTTAIIRASSGSSCLDSGNNSSDFAALAPTPRNASSAAQACRAGSSGGGGSGGTAATPAFIYQIQGSGATSPLVGQAVITSGVVTKVNNNGFFIQDLNGDNNPLTSDGIFVFGTPGNYPAVAVGNLVQVTGTVAEFNVGASTNADTLAHTVTELTSVSAVTLQGTGYTIAPTVVSLPEAVDGDLERYEGMLVTLTGPLTVNQNFFQGRYGQLTLAAGGRLETPTNKYRPGSAQAIALADENARRRIVLDDGSSLQNANPIPYLGADGVRRAGDTLASVTGVIDYGLATSSNTGFGDYKIHPSVAPVFTPGNVRTALPDAVGGNVKVASFNVLNYFTAFTNGGGTANGCSLGGSVSTANCRGADNAAEFARQQTKIVKAMAALNADVLGLMEIQNNGNTAAQNLVTALNAEVGAGTYVTTSLPTNTGTDAIRVAMIYKPARLSPVGSAVSDTDAVNNRPTLAQTFSLANGQRFTLVVNHLKSKGSCPAAGDADYTGNFDAGDGQGCWNLRRRDQATRLRSFVQERQAAAGSADVLLIGDFNAYAQEDPIFDLTSNGFVDQVGRFAGFGYSYVFDGAAGRLDHAIATATLSAKVSKVAHWHINADEPSVIDYNTEFKAPATGCASTCPTDPYSATPYRSSDHDPVVVGLNLVDSVITAAAGATVVSGTAGDDLINLGAGRRSVTGGAGRDQFVFTAGFAGGATITDFEPGVDTISLRAVLAGLGITAANPIAQGYVTCTASGSDALISVDPDATGPAVARPMVLVKGRSCAATLSNANFVF